MLIVKNVTINGGNGYASTPTFGVTVQFQVGDRSYSTVDIKLTPEDARDVIEMAIRRATAMLRVLPSEIRIEGETFPDAVAPVADTAEDPEFAEVEPYVEPYEPPVRVRLESGEVL